MSFPHVFIGNLLVSLESRSNGNDNNNAGHAEMFLFSIFLDSGSRAGMKDLLKTLRTTFDDVNYEIPA